MIMPDSLRQEYEDYQYLVWTGTVAGNTDSECQMHRFGQDLVTMCVCRTQKQRFTGEQKKEPQYMNGTSNVKVMSCCGLYLQFVKSQQ